MKDTKTCSKTEVLKLWGRPPGEDDVGTRGGGGSCLYEGNIYFERNMGTI
jgi:hypothetical protein